MRVSPEGRAVKLSRELSGTSLDGLAFRGRGREAGLGPRLRARRRPRPCLSQGLPRRRDRAFVGLDGLPVESGRDSTIQIQDLYFVKAGSVRIGSYEDDDPRDERDPRLIAFGDVPPIVYSEVMGDLERIVGPSGAEEAEPGED